MDCDRGILEAANPLIPLPETLEQSPLIGPAGIQLFNNATRRSGRAARLLTLTSFLQEYARVHSTMAEK